jgi:hypothetical protein
MVSSKNKQKKMKEAKARKGRSDRTKRCAVKDCESRVGGELRFFQFPKDKRNGGFLPLAKVEECSQAMPLKTN